MNDFQKKYILKRQDYGLLYPYLADEKVTHIDWNGRQLWIEHLEKGRYMADDILPAEFVERFVLLIANVTNQVFSYKHPVMETETEEIHIHVVHRSIAHLGTAICVQKTPVIRRLNHAGLIEEGYCNETVLHFLRYCVEAHLNIVICGLPEAGKTELLKFLTKYISPAERAITIEEVLEIHYQKMNPNKDCVEMKVAEEFSYAKAIHSCLRQFPKWLILSEIRSEEVKYWLEAISTGIGGLTTIQCDDVRRIPERMAHMLSDEKDEQRAEQEVYRYVDVGIMVKREKNTDGSWHRKIEQIALYNRSGRNWKETVNQTVMLVEEGNLQERKLPDRVLRKFEEIGIMNPLGGAV